MMPFTTALACLAAILLPQVAAQCQDPQPRNGNPQMASGYQSKVLTNGLRVPRHLALDSEGNLLVAEQGGGGIRRIVLEDNGGLNVCVASSDPLIPNGQVSSLACSTAELNHYLYSEDETGPGRGSL